MSAATRVIAFELNFPYVFCHMVCEHELIHAFSPTGSEPGINVTTVTNRAGYLFISSTTLLLDSPLNGSQYSLRLSVDTDRGPIEIYVFPGNQNLPEFVTLPDIQMPESSTYYVAEKPALNQTDGTPLLTADGNIARPIVVDRNMRMIIQKQSVVADVRTSFVRSYEEYEPPVDGRLYTEDDKWIGLPRYPQRDLARYKSTIMDQNETFIVSQNFKIDDAFTNDTGLYQFDVTVLTAGSDILYRISAPFLLRRQRYDLAFVGHLPCSPYRRDSSEPLHVTQIGFVVGEIPCTRTVLIGLRDPAARHRFRVPEWGRKYTGNYHATKYIPSSFTWAPRSLDDFKVLYHLVYPSNQPQPWYDRYGDPENTFATVTDYKYSKYGLLRAMTFVPYTPITLVNQPDQVTAQSVSSLKYEK